MSQQGSGQASRERVDALIVTAIEEEYDAVLEVGTGARPGSDWERRVGPTGFEVALRSFEAVGGGMLRVAVTRSREMGGVAAVIAASPIVQAYSPRCLAMCGVCAGRRGQVELGDVIIADRLWTHDTGMIEAPRQGQGPESSRGLSDISQYRLPARWKEVAGSFSAAGASSWLSLRPRSHEAQQDWVLERLLAGEDPRKHFDRAARCADYEQVIEQLWKEGHVEDGKLRLTDRGRERIERLMNRYPNGLPEPRPFKVHVGPLATGSKVVKDPRIFDEVARSVRKVLGLDMESSAIGALAHEQGIPYAIVMKGVMDFGDPEKADRFKAFAARASAECLLSFLRAHLPPAESLRKDAGAHDRLLVTGTVKPPRERSPAALLNARYQFVEFFRPVRAGLLRELQAWCDEDEPVSVRLFHGAGGVGKTHLFIQWCQELRDQGWRAGFLGGDVDAERFESLMSASAARPTLVVIDYAESHQGLGALLQMAARLRSDGGGGRLRLALIAREPGAWWEELQKRSAELAALLRDRLPVEVPPVAPTGAEREDVFWHAARRFAELLGRALPTRLPSSLEDPSFGRVLYIHMAALAAVMGSPFTAETLMGGILEHEEHFWATWLETRKQPGAADGDRRLFQDRVRHAVTALTLSGGAPSRQEAVALLERSCGVRDELLLLLLHDLYPRGSAAAGSWAVGGLEPDLLGESLVFRMLREEGKSAAEWLRRVFNGADEGAVRTGFEVLGRLSASTAEAGAWIASLLEGAVELRAVAALEAAKAVGQRTAYAALGGELEKALEREGTPDVARRLMEAGLPERTISLRGVALWVMTVLLKHLPPGESTESLAARAQLLHNLGLFQSQLGRKEEALESAQGAVDSYRVLARMSPEVFLSPLATGLINLSAFQTELGKREESLVSAQEAVSHYRTLVQKHSEVFLPELAMSLLSLGKSQHQLRRREEALESALEAVGHYRTLAQQQPEGFLPNLAHALNNLGLYQSELGRRAPALEFGQEAVRHYRVLVQKHVEAFLPDLAMSLISQGAFQSELGKREDALASTQEAVSHYQTLAQKHPEAFLPDLALALINLGSFLSELRRREEALAAAQEAVSHYRTLAGKRPDAFLPILATSLMNLGSFQGELGRREEALGAAQEAVIHYRTLVQRHPEVFLPDLAMSLLSLGQSHDGLGNREEALDATKEAVSHYRALAQKHPETFLPGLAHGLNNLGSFQGELGRREEALGCALEAVIHYRTLAQKHPEAFLPDLAMSLLNLGKSQSQLGRREEALDSTQEALSHYRALSRTRPEVFLGDLANGLNNLGLFQGALGKKEEALGSVLEAVGLYRVLVQKHPEAFQSDLAMSLMNLGQSLSEAGRREESLEITQEAVGYYRKLAQKHSEAFLPDLAKSLNNLSHCQRLLGSSKEALSSAKESLDILWPFFLARPRAFEHDTGVILEGLIARYREAGSAPPDELLKRQKILKARRKPRPRA